MEEGEPDSHFLIKIIREARTFLRKRSFYLGLILIIVLSGGLVFVSGKKIISLSSRNFSSLSIAIEKNLSNKSTFIASANNFLSDSSEMSFLQDNTLIAVSSPAMVTPRILGSIIGDEGVGTRNEIVKYNVKSGDTLSSIAAKFNISLQTILWANGLKSNSAISPRQELIILPVSGVLHTVKKNDTLGAIAKSYKVNTKEIVVFNELSEKADIFIGDLLIIPGGQMPRTVSSVALTPVASSYFIFPCEGKISQGLHYYNAIDIANKCGKPVVAASGGAVQSAGWIKIGGKRVTILHSNGVVTYYGHLSTILVVPGQRVNAGDIIGYIGNTGYTLGATGCHLHFAVIGAKNFLASYPVGSSISWKK